MSEEKKQQAFITEQSNLEDLPDSTEEQAKQLQPENSESRQSGETTEGEYYEDDRSKTRLSMFFF